MVEAVLNSGMGPGATCTSRMCMKQDQERLEMRFEKNYYTDFTVHVGIVGL